MQGYCYVGPGRRIVKLAWGSGESNENNMEIGIEIGTIQHTGRARQEYYDTLPL